MTKSFNTLEDSGAVYALTEEQKINHFESGIKEAVAVSYSIQARKDWDALPLAEQSFERYYTIFSASYSRHNSLTRSQQQSRNSQFSRIAEVNTGRGGRNTQGRGRGARGRGGRRGRGRGRASRSYNPYSMARQYGVFQAEARVYPRDQWMNLTQDQRKEVMNKKIEARWIDGSTPPPGYTLDSDGRAVMEQGLVNVIRSQISSMNTEAGNTDNNGGLVALPPPPSQNAPVPPIVTANTTASSAGGAFGRQGTRQRSSDSSTIASVTINGRSYNGPVYDVNGNIIQ